METAETVSAALQARVIEPAASVDLPAHVKPITCESVMGWRRARVPTFGASSIAKLFGVGGTPLELYAEKVMEQDALDAGLPLPEEVVTEPMELGLEFEPAICSIFAKRNPGMRVVAPPPFTLYRNEKYPLLHASPDRFLIDAQRAGYGLLEAKSTGGQHLKDWDDEEAPERVLVQTQAQMLVLESEWGFANAIVGTFGFTVRTKPVAADKSFQELMLEEVERFAKNHLLPRNPPPPSDPDDIDAVKRLYRRASAGKSVDLGPEFIVKADELESFRAAKRANENAEKQVAAVLQLGIGDAEVGILPDGRRISWKNEDAHFEATPAHVIHKRVLRVLKAQKGGAK